MGDGSRIQMLSTAVNLLRESRRLFDVLALEVDNLVLDPVADRQLLDRPGPEASEEGVDDEEDEGKVRGDGEVE